MKNNNDTMDYETETKTDENEKDAPQQKKDSQLSTSILIAAIILAGTWIYTTSPKNTGNSLQSDSTQESGLTQVSSLEEAVIPSDGVVLPVSWGNLGSKLVDTGTIDSDKLKAIYSQRGFTEEYESLLVGQNEGKLKITRENSGYLLNLFWALGLANKNEILEKGEMTNPKYGGAGNFASTGGWTIAVGNPMDHYSMHTLFTLTGEQQAMVDRVSRGIYRPCCGNSTHFPDCNHGMAMLGLLQLMASQGVSEEEMWKTALVVNSYWFPDTYITIATYMENNGVEWEDVDAKEVLGANYSSGSGYANIASQVITPNEQGGGNGCGV